MRPIALAALLPLSVFFVQTPTRETPQLIRDVRLFDGDRVQEHRSVLVENGTITRIAGCRSTSARTNANAIGFAKKMLRRGPAPLDGCSGCQTAGPLRIR